MLKPISQCLAALAECFFFHVISNAENLSVQNRELKKMEIMKIFVLGYYNHKVMENIFNVQCGLLV